MAGSRASIRGQIALGCLCYPIRLYRAPIANDNAIERLPLFDYSRVSAPGDGGTQSSIAIIEARERALPRVRLWSTVDINLCFGQYSYQLHLPMSLNEFTNVVRLVPSYRYPALNNHFPSLVCKDETLSKLAVILAHRRKLRLGDVIQMSEGELLALLKGNKGALERLRGHLQPYALDFGMRAPRWKSPGGLLAPDW